MAANIQLTLTKLSVGYKAEVFATDPSHTGMTPTRFVMQVDASGHFVYDTKTADRTFHLGGQLSTDLSTITGTFTETRKDGTSTGTVSLNRAANTSARRPRRERSP